VDQNVALDPSWKSIVVSAKMRTSPDFKPGKQATGVTVTFHDDNRKPVGGFQTPVAVRQAIPNWREDEVTLRVPPGARRIYLQCVIAYTKGTIDFDDVKVRGVQ